MTGEDDRNHVLQPQASVQWLPKPEGATRLSADGYCGHLGSRQDWGHSKHLKGECTSPTSNEQNTCLLGHCRLVRPGLGASRSPDLPLTGHLFRARADQSGWASGASGQPPSTEGWSWRLCPRGEDVGRTEPEWETTLCGSRTGLDKRAWPEQSTSAF